MSTIKEYVVKINGDISNLIKQLEGLKAITKHELDEVLGQLVIGVDLSQSQSNVDAAFETIKKNIPDLELQMRFDQASDNLTFYTNQKDIVKEQNKIYEDIFNGFDPGNANKDQLESVREQIKLQIKKMYDDLADYVSSGDVEGIRTKIQNLLDFQALVKKDKKVANALGKDKDFKNSYFYDPQKLKDEIEKINGLAPYLKSAKNENGAISLGAMFGAPKDLNSVIALMQHWLSIKNKYEAQLSEKGIDPSSINVFEASIKKAADSAQKTKSVAKDTSSGLNEVGSAAQKTGEQIQGAASSTEDLSDKLKKIDASALKAALQELINILEELTTTTFIPDIDRFKDTLKKAFSQTGAKERKEFIESSFNGVDKKAALDIYNMGNSMLQKGELDLNDDKSLDEYTNRVIDYLGRAGIAIDGFVQKRRTLNQADEMKVSSSIDTEQITRITDAISGLHTTIRSLRGSGGNLEEFTKSIENIKTVTHGLQDDAGVDYLLSISNAISELSEVIQRATGVVSTSALNKEFESIQNFANSLGNGDLSQGYKDLQAIVDQFNAYKSAGGTKELADISSNDALVEKLKRVSDASEEAAQKQRELAAAEAEAAKIASETQAANIESYLRGLATNSEASFMVGEKALPTTIGLLNDIASSTAPKTLEEMANALGQIYTNSEASLRINAADMIQAQPAIDAIRSIVDALNELVDAFKRVNGDAALNLDELFNSIQKQASSISHAQNYTVTGKAKSIADEIYSRYMYYQQRGGDKELRVSKNLQSYWDSYTPEQKESIGLSAETKEFAEIEKAALDAAAGKELFAEANGEAQAAAQKTVAELEKERAKFKEVGEAAAEAAKHKEGFARGFSQIFGNVGDLASYASALKSYASILNGVGTSEIKRNKLSTKDFSDFSDLKSLINGDATLKGMYSQRLDDLDLQIGAFMPGVDSIDDVRKAMADLRSDAEVTATALKNAANSAAKTTAQQNKKIANDFKDLKKSTKNITKMLGTPEAKRDLLQNSQWDSYFDQYESAMNSVSGKTLDELPSQVSGTVQEISNVLEGSMSLVSKIDEIKDASSGYTQEYKKQLEGLEPSITKITTGFKAGNFALDKVLGMNKDELKEYLEIINNIKIALDQASDNKLAKTEDVQKILNKAYKIDASNNNNKEISGQVAAITDELERAKNSTAGLQEGFANISAARLKEVDEEVNKLSGDVDRTGSRIGTFSQNLASQMTSQMASLVAQYTSIRFMFRYAKQIAQTVTAVDSAITELRKVSGASNTRLAESFKTSAETAQELGATITDVINSTADWSRLGYGIDQAEDLARVTQLLQTVGDNMTQETASKSLVSILQGYQLDPSQAERTVDSLNEVANNFAIDTAGIGEALQRSAAALNASGTDLNKSIALVTTANAVLQNPETVGTMFKTMSARIRGATTELNELGEEEDEFTQTTSKLRDLVLQLTGFDIMKDENTFKDIYEILLGIGDKWKDLTDIQQASLGEALAGKRGINALFSVLNNTEGLEKAYKTALGAEGSAEKEQEAYAQSVQYSIDRVKASAQELSVSFMSSDFLKGLMEGLNSFLQLLTKITDKLGTLGSVATALGTIDLVRTVLTGGQRGFAGTVIMSLAKTLNDNSEIKGLGNAFKLITLKAGEAGTNAGGLMAKNLFAALASSPGAAVAGVAIAAAIGAAIYSYLKKRQQDLINEAKSSANQWEENKKTLSGRYDDVSNLRKQLQDETLSETQRLDIKKQIYEIQKQITSEYGAQASGIDLINGDLEQQKNLLTQISEGQARLNLAENAAAYREATKVATDKKSDYAAEIIGESEEFRQQIIGMISEYDSLSYEVLDNATGDIAIRYDGMAKDITEDVNGFLNKLEELRIKTQQEKSAAIIANPDDINAINSYYDTQLSAINRAADQISSRTKKIREDYADIQSTFETKLEMEFFEAGGGKLAMEASDVVSEMQDAIIEGNRSGVYELYEEYQQKFGEIEQLASKIGWDDSSLDVFKNSIKNGFDEATIDGFRLIDILDIANSSYKQITEAADDYNKTVAEGNKLGIDRDKTTYGNVNLEDRAVVNWNKENIERYGDAIKSWGRDTAEYSDVFREQGEAAAEAWLNGYVESYEGSYSTVDAGSTAFMIDGKEVEIAFTPLLQTGDGKAEYLDKDTVYDYINAVIQRASEEGDVSMENILRIDAGSTIEGFENIHGLIADIGDSAIKTGEAMHYIGSLGAENDALKRYSDTIGVLTQNVDENNPFKDQAEDIVKYSTAIKSAGLDTVDVQQILAGEAVNTTDEVKQAITELLELTGLTGDALNNALANSGIVFGGVDKEIEHIKEQFSTFHNDIQKRYSNLDNLNASLAASATGKGLNPFGEKDEEGNISSDVGNITKAFKDLESFHPEDVFRHTANGVKVNEKELRRLQKEQDKVTRKKFLQKQKELTDQLVEAERKRNTETNEAKIRGYENEIATIRQNLMELGQLQTAYEGATSAYQKWLDAQSAGERGDIYDNIRETAVKRADELYKEGLVGTNEFRALAELISGEDLSTASADKVEAAYKQIDAAIEGTSMTLRNFYEEGGQGVDNFIQTLLDLGHATQDGDIVNFKNLNTTELAEQLHTSVDWVEAALEKLNDYGFDITWRTAEQADMLDGIEKKYEKIKSTFEGKTFRGMNLDLNQLDTIEELDHAAESVQYMLDHPMQFSIDDSEAQALYELLGLIEEKRKVLEMPTGGQEFTVENYRQAQSSLAEIKSQIHDINESGVEHMGLSEDAKEAAEWLASLDDDIKIALGIELTSDSEKLLASLGYNPNGTSSSKPQTPTVAMNVQPQPRQTRQQRENTRAETTINTNVQKEEVHKVEDIKVTADTSQLELAQQAVDAFTAGLPPEEIASRILCEVYGVEDVEELKEVADEAAVDRAVEVVADAVGTGDVREMVRTIGGLTGKSVPVTANVNKTPIENFISWFNNLRLTTTATINYKTIGNIGGALLGNHKLDGTAHARGTISGFAYAHGNWGLRHSERALVGELGEELYVDPRDSSWHTIGTNGAEFVDLPKGAIVFNHLQTKELLENGYTHGRAHASGTALANSTSGSGKRSRTKGKSSGGKSSGGKSSGGKSSGKSSGNSNSAKDAAEKAADDIKDWVEVLLDRVSHTFENFKEMSEYWTSYKNQNREINNAISQAEKNITWNQKAYQRYIKQANSVGLNAKYAKQVREGTIDIESIKDEKLKEKIESYTEWYLIMPTQSAMIV